MVSLSDYVGREHAYVKHVFLERYLEALIFKTASTFNHIVYIDGFAGPWQSANEEFADTSFGIALNALRRAKETWQKSKRNVLRSCAAWRTWYSRRSAVRHGASGRSPKASCS
jgi:three-Cys-motif partner protein